MNMPKCPVCQSTDINSITCNNCGAMLLYMGDKNKDADSSLPKKENKSTESIIKEILESANVKTSPFEKIEYIDYNGADSQSADDISNIVADKSFAELALEMGFEKNVDSDVSSTDTTEATEVSEEASESEETESQEVTDIPVTKDEYTEDAVSECECASEELTASEDEDATIDADTAKESELQDMKVSLVERISQKVNEKIEKDELATDNTEHVTDEQESTVEQTSGCSDRVERISRKINEKIEKEEILQNANMLQDDEDLFSEPVWKNSEKMTIKEKKKTNQPQADENTYADIMNIDLKFNKTLNVCRFLLMILMFVTVVCMFLPSTRLGGFSSGQSVQIFAVISVIPFTVGFVLCIKEKQYIRKFIYSLIISLLFAFVYSVFMLSFSSSGTKGMVYLLLCALITVVSVIGIRADKSSGIRKINTWFDAFTYIQFFVNVLVILFVLMFAVLVPDMAGEHAISMYLFELCMIMALCAVSAILMLKRFSFGADLFMFSTIAFIVANIISYNKVLAAVSFDYTVNIPYMSYMGMAVSMLNVFCTLFAVGMFFWMRYIKKITPEKI